MSVSSVNGAQASFAYYQQKKAAEPEAKKETAAAPKSQDTYEKTEKIPQYTIDTDKISAMKADLNNNIATFKKMVAALVQKQGNTVGGAHAELLKIDEATQLAAQEAISDDGYWGVEKTATRILDFAKALSGGDPSKIGILRDAFLEGFRQAEKAWGGTLPDISQKTYDRVMEGFKEWEDSFSE